MGRGQSEGGVSEIDNSSIFAGPALGLLFGTIGLALIALAGWGLYLRQRRPDRPRGSGKLASAPAGELGGPANTLSLRPRATLRRAGRARDLRDWSCELSGSKGPSTPRRPGAH